MRRHAIAAARQRRQCLSACPGEALAISSALGAEPIARRSIPERDMILAASRAI